MNALNRERVYMRSIAARDSRSEVTEALGECLTVLRAAPFDFIIVETAGIGQGDAAIVPHVDATAYVMTSEFGSASQLEKIDMLDLADFVAINKFDHRGADDALRDVRKQYQRNHRLFDQDLEAMPVYGTIASKFNDDGITALYQAIVKIMNERTRCAWKSSLAPVEQKTPSSKTIIIPPERTRYLAEVADTVERYHKTAAQQAGVVQKLWQLDGAKALFSDDHDDLKKALKEKRENLARELSPECTALLDRIPKVREQYAQDETVYTVRGKEIHTVVHRRSLSGTKVPRVALPKYQNPGDQVRWINDVLLAISTQITFELTRVSIKHGNTSVTITIGDISYVCFFNNGDFRNTREI